MINFQYFFFYIFKFYAPDYLKKTLFYFNLKHFELPMHMK